MTELKIRDLDKIISNRKSNDYNLIDDCNIFGLDDDKVMIEYVLHADLNKRRISILIRTQEDFDNINDMIHEVIEPKTGE